MEALRESTRLSTQRYQGGVDNYLQVLDAQRNLFQGELDLARIRQQELASIVQLYRALGGGWSDRERDVDKEAIEGRDCTSSSDMARRGTDDVEETTWLSE